MNISPDWKFWLVLVATVASVVAPVWLWRSDLTSRALTVSVASRTALSPALSHPPTDLQISIGGRTLVDPYSSIVEIANTGAKPILSAEIEGSINLDITGASKLVQAKVVESHPPSLSPSLDVKGQRVSIQPLLLNPGDAITIAVLTENGSPTLLPRARIAGISDIAFQETSSKSSTSRRKWVGAMLAPLAVAGAFMLFFMWLDPHRSFHFSGIAVSAVGILGIATLAAVPMWDEYFPSVPLPSLAFSFSLSLAGALFSLLFLRQRRSTPVARSRDDTAA